MTLETPMTWWIILSSGNRNVEAGCLKEVLRILLIQRYGRVMVGAYLGHFYCRTRDAKLDEENWFRAPPKYTCRGMTWHNIEWKRNEITWHGPTLFLLHHSSMLGFCLTSEFCSGLEGHQWNYPGLWPNRLWKGQHLFASPEKLLERLSQMFSTFIKLIDWYGLIRRYPLENVYITMENHHAING